MKKLLILIIGCLLSSIIYSQQDLLPAFPDEITYQGDRAYFNGSPFTGLLIDKKTNIRWGEFKNGFKNGLFTEYYSNGKKKSEGSFVNGVKVGSHTEWFENGQKEKMQSFDNGIPSGDYMGWNIKGNLIKKISYESGKIKDGYYSIYDENGTQIKVVTYDNEYITNEIYNNGKYISYYENGNIKSEGLIADNGNQGLYIEFWENGQKKAEGNYDNGQKIGQWVSWDQNGAKRAEKNYSLGKLDGKSTFWEENGDIKIELYDKGILIDEQNKLNFTGHYNSEYSFGDYYVVDKKLYYKSNLAKIQSAYFKVNKKPIYRDDELWVNGSSILSTNMDITGFKQVGSKYYYTYSICITYENGEVFIKAENMQDYSVSNPCNFGFDYDTSYLKKGASTKILYFNFLIKDKYSDAIIQGFYKLRFLL
jgi:antitoxin component YwqK of YwqJK toxin-antitoxin module